MNCTIRKLDTGGVVSTIAGSVGHGGYDDGTGITARFTYPTSGTIAPSTNLYLLDGLGAIRKVTPAGQVTTLAGSGKVSGSSDGVGYAAQFNRPLAITVSPAGDLYVADTGNNTVRKVTTTGVVSTFAGDPNSFGTADGTGNNARFYGPSGIASDSEGNLYVADAYNYTLRKVSPNRAVSTLAGKAGVSGSSDGTGSAARFGQLAGLAVGPAGTLYAADAGNHTIRKVSPTGVVTTLAGSAGRPGSTDGQGSIARFNRPTSLATDGAGNIYVADTDNCLVRMISPTGKVATLGGRPGWVGGRDGVGRDALFASPSGIAVDPSGNLLVVDAWNNSVSRGVLIPQPTLLLSWSNGLAHLRVAGMPGTTYRWEYTASLDPGGTWQTLSGQTNWFLTNSPALFIDSSASPNEPRFYRMRLVLP
jgi:sugar lactone lactonase YvrE